VDVLLIGAAGRVAAGGTSTHGRLVTAVDVVVRPLDVEKAFQALTRSGWHPATQEAVVDHPTRLCATSSMALIRGQFGSLRLHRAPFYPPHAAAPDDASVWDRATSGRIVLAPVRLPSAEDALAITLAQRERGGYWMADVAASIDAGVEWELFQSIADHRRLQVPGIVALSYVHARLGRRVPVSVLRRLENCALRHPAELANWLLQTRLTVGSPGARSVARAVARQGRLLGSLRRLGFSSRAWRDAWIEAPRKSE
jgi:hypothetical protein